MSPRPRPAAADPDPLADLRPSDDAPPPEPSPAEPEQAAEADAEPLHDQGWHDQRVACMVAAWHSDPTSNGFVHHGGNCGCRYIARVALQAAAGAPVEPELDGEDGEPDGSE